MQKITIGENEKNQRVDRYLRKYLASASLSTIYKIIRKDLKLNGKRVRQDHILSVGDVMELYLDDEEFNSLKRKEKPFNCNSFGNIDIVFENDKMLIANKPHGLLVHGDSKEKKKTLTNQVRQYLYDKGEIDMSAENIFQASSANRLDRNTTGLVVFCKTPESMRNMNEMIRSEDCVEKFYLTIVKGELKGDLYLRDELIRDHERNISSVKSADTVIRSETQSDDGYKKIATFVTSVKSNCGFSLVRVRLDTGRTHQIRAHLKHAGYPLAGDIKYGDHKTNEFMKDKYKLSTQLLHAYELRFSDCIGELAELKGLIVRAELPVKFKEIASDMDLL